MLLDGVWLSRNKKDYILTILYYIAHTMCAMLQQFHNVPFYHLVFYRHVNGVTTQHWGLCGPNVQNSTTCDLRRILAVITPWSMNDWQSGRWILCLLNAAGQDTVIHCKMRKRLSLLYAYIWCAVDVIISCSASWVTNDDITSDLGSFLRP